MTWHALRMRRIRSALLLLPAAAAGHLSHRGDDSGPSEAAGLAPYTGKVVFDWLVVAAACVALGPVAVAAALAIWIEGASSPLILEKRVGRGRKPFTAVKFRTTSRNRVTGVGRILQRTRLSELPLLINVARGEMSIVGPPALTLPEAERLGCLSPSFDWRFSARPGIVGLSQLLSGGNVRLGHRLDRLYLNRQSVRSDVLVIAASFATQVLWRPRARRWLRRLGTLGNG
jgi:undecaprenyl phosphate N,N'-diacetylbacillosamine 1-phosphate transferase